MQHLPRQADLPVVHVGGTPDRYFLFFFFNCYHQEEDDDDDDATCWAVPMMRRDDDERIWERQRESEAKEVKRSDSAGYAFQQQKNK